MKRLRLIALLLTTALTLSLAACGEPEPEPVAEVVTPTPTPTPTPIPKTKVTYTYTVDEYTEWLKECEAAYEAKNDKIDIILNKVDELDYANVGDAFMVTSERFGECLEAGAAANLESYVSKARLYKEEDYVENVWNMFTKGETLYALPLSYETIGFWYNKKLFDEAGVAYPNGDWNWMSIVDAAGSLTRESDGIYGIGADYTSILPISVTIYEMGGSIFNEDGSLSNFNNALNMAGIRCFTDLIEAGYSPSAEAIESKAAEEWFLEGNLAMIYAGNSLAGRVFAAENAADFGCTYLPTLKGNRATPVSGYGNCVAESSQNKDIAWDFVKFISTDSACIEGFISVSELIPAYSAASEKYITQVGGDSNLFVFADQARDSSYVFPRVSGLGEQKKALAERLLSVYELKDSVDEACLEIGGTEINNSENSEN